LPPPPPPRRAPTPPPPVQRAQRQACPTAHQTCVRGCVACASSDRERVSINHVGALVRAHVRCRAPCKSAHIAAFALQISSRMSVSCSCFNSASERASAARRASRSAANAVLCEADEAALMDASAGPRAGGAWRAGGACGSDGAAASGAGCGARCEPLCCAGGARCEARVSAPSVSARQRTCREDVMRTRSASSSSSSSSHSSSNVTEKPPEPPEEREPSGEGARCGAGCEELSARDAAAAVRAPARRSARGAPCARRVSSS
jgi:hypothetical protein